MTAMRVGGWTGGARPQGRAVRLAARAGLGLCLTWLGALGAGCAGESDRRAATTTLPSQGLANMKDVASPEGATESTPEMDALARRFEEDAEMLARLAVASPSAEMGRVAREPTSVEGVRANIAATVERPAGELRLDGARGFDDEMDVEEIAGAAESAEAASEPVAPAVRETAEARRARLAGELAAALREGAAESESPLVTYAALAALEVLEGGVSAAEEGVEEATLSPREREVLAAWRGMHRAVREAAGSGSAEPLGEKVAEAVADAAERLAELETVRISRAALCSRVDGFGVFEELPGVRLLAGRAHRAIVYVEVDRFALRAASGPNGEAGHIVELAQELNLYHDADGLLAWRKADEVVKDFSRNKRRDFYMVRMVELPETLTVGAYRLKVTVKDKATGAVAEAILPVEVVADAGLLGRK